jgi:lipopolysaccharide exporter
VADPQLPSISQRTLIGSIWMIAWRMLTRALGVISTLVMARLLTPADFGLLAMASVFTSAVEAMSQIGVWDALMRTPELDDDLMNTGFTITLIRSVMSAAVLVILAPVAAVWFNEPRLLPVILALSAVTAMTGIENIGVVHLRREMQASQLVTLMLVPRVAQVAIAITAALILHSYWALVIGVVTSKILYVVMGYRQHPHRPRLTLHRWRELAMFSLWSWAASLARLVWNRVDAFVLGRQLGSRQLGVYLLGAEMALLPITELVEPVINMLFPGIAAARKRGTDAISLVPEVFTTLLLGVVPLALTISAAANCMIGILLGPQWAAAVPVITILAIACAISPFSYVCFTALVVSGEMRRDFQVMAVAATARAVLIYLAGTTGDTRIVALAFVATTMLEASLFWMQIRRVGQPDYAIALGSLFRLATATAVTGSVLYASGLGWNEALPGLLPAILNAGLIGVIALGGCLGGVLVLWRSMGRPAGAEARALDLLTAFLAASPLPLAAPLVSMLRRVAGFPHKAE